MSAAFTLVIPDEPSGQDRESVLAPLRAFNEAAAGPARAAPVAILLRDEAGGTVGGLWGRSGYDWLFVEYLVVPAAARGQGTGSLLIGEAERIARARGCIGLWLDTYDFQARGFYQKLGFRVFGTIADHPVGSARHFLAKRLVP